MRKLFVLFGVLGAAAIALALIQRVSDTSEWYGDPGEVPVIGDGLRELGLLSVFARTIKSPHSYFPTMYVYGLCDAEEFRKVIEGPDFVFFSGSASLENYHLEQIPDDVRGEFEFRDEDSYFAGPLKNGTFVQGAIHIGDDGLAVVLVVITELRRRN